MKSGPFFMPQFFGAMVFAVELACAALSQAANPGPKGPDFPLFMYGAGNPPVGSNFVPSGWNILQDYGANTTSTINTYLQACASISEAGPAIIPAGGKDAETGALYEMTQSQVQSCIQAVSGNSNLVWWNLPEEVREWVPSEMTMLTNYSAWTRLYDPQQRPNYEYTPDAYVADDISLLSVADVIGISAYCELNSMPHAFVRYKTQDVGVAGIRQAGKSIGANYLSGQKLPVCIISIAKNLTTGAMPTPAQSYHDFWSAIASGSRGVGVWAYWHAIHDDPALAECLAQVHAAATQITGPEQLGDVIMNGAADPGVDFTIQSGPATTAPFVPVNNRGSQTAVTYPSLNVLCKARNGNVYVIAVNSTDQPITARINNLQTTVSSASVLFQSRTVSIDSGSLADDFPAWGVNIYKMPLAAGSPPGAPTALVATTVSGSQINLSWAASPGAASYNVQRALMSGGPYITVAGELTDTTFTDTELTSSTTCYYRVVAVNVHGESSYSSESSATTQVWTHVNDTDLNIVYANFAYSSNRNVGDYKSDVHYATSNGSSAQFTFIGTGVQYLTETYADEGNVDVYLDGTYQTTVNCNTATRQTQQAVYSVTNLGFGSHTIKVVKTGGTYMLLDAFAVGNVGAPPAGPAELTGSAGSSSGINLSWTASSRAIGYNVKRAAASGGPYTTVATAVAGTIYNDTGLMAATTYYYVVSAINAGGESPDSPEAGTATQVAIPSSPTGLSAVTGNSQVVLGWTASPGAASYSIKRALVSGGPYSTVSNTTATDCTDTGLANGTTYYYVISAANAAGEGANSFQVSEVPTDSPALPRLLKSSDVGNVAAVGSASYANGSYTLTGSGADIWGKADEFHFVHQPINGDCDIKVRVTGLQYTHNRAKAGVMIRETLAANSRHALVDVTPTAGVEFIRRTITGGSSSATNSAGITAPYWVRLVRADNTFTAYRSTNGMSWTAIGSANIAMGTAVHVGLAVSSHADGVLNTAVFDNFSVVSLPSPWASADVGAVGSAGGAKLIGTIYAVTGSGADIGSTGDEFRFAYQTATGDCDITARVTDVPNTHPWAKAGVVIRETLSAGSVNAAVLLTPSNGVTFQRRTSTGDTSTNDPMSGTGAPYWVRLVRSGNTFTAYRSPDGLSWTSAGSVSIPMSTSVYIGLAVTSASDGDLNTSTFESVMVTP